jgi:geranylgeranyl diphosphate synthase, type I
MIEEFLASIETELQRVVAKLDISHTKPFYEMLTYHMGWTGEGAGPEATGKRIRPLLVLLTTAACDASWQSALPAAAAVELIHNFSLIHDDIQDQSELRRGRPAVWNKWGTAHAINAGDALFILAHLAMLELKNHNVPPETAMKAGQIVNDACLALTSGQFMDLSYETRTDLSIEQNYWPMISGKTAALLAACTHVGAVIGGADESTQEAYRSYGNFLGIAFQVQDDYLGIWGDSALTGKSVESDLVTGKKSLPVLYGLAKKGPFAKRWLEGPVRADDVPHLAEQLAAEGARLFTQQTADQMTDLALNSMREADPQGDAGEVLFELTGKLLNRQN